MAKQTQHTLNRKESTSWGEKRILQCRWRWIRLSWRMVAREKKASRRVDSDLTEGIDRGRSNISQPLHACRAESNEKKSSATMRNLASMRKRNKRKKWTKLPAKAKFVQESEQRSTWKWGQSKEMLGIRPSEKNSEAKMKFVVRSRIWNQNVHQMNEGTRREHDKTNQSPSWKEELWRWLTASYYPQTDESQVKNPSSLLRAIWKVESWQKWLMIKAKNQTIQALSRWFKRKLEEIDRWMNLSWHSSRKVIEYSTYENEGGKKVRECRRNNRLLSEVWMKGMQGIRNELKASDDYAMMESAWRGTQGELRKIIFVYWLQHFSERCQNGLYWMNTGEGEEDLYYLKFDTKSILVEFQSRSRTRQRALIMHAS